MWYALGLVNAFERLTGITEFNTEQYETISESNCVIGSTFFQYDKIPMQKISLFSGLKIVRSWHWRFWWQSY